MAPKYGPKASEKVEKAMHEMKRGKLRSGRSGRKVKSRKQAIAIGLSQARRRRGQGPEAARAGRPKQTGPRLALAARVRDADLRRRAPAHIRS